MKTLARTIGSRHALGRAGDCGLDRAIEPFEYFDVVSPRRAWLQVAAASESGGSRETRGAGWACRSESQPIVQLNRKSSAWVSAPAPWRRISASVQAVTASPEAV